MVEDGQQRDRRDWERTGGEAEPIGSPERPGKIDEGEPAADRVAADQTTSFQLVEALEHALDGGAGWNDRHCFTCTRAGRSGRGASPGEKACARDGISSRSRPPCE